MPEKWLSPLHAVQYILTDFTVEQIVQALVEQVGKERIQKILGKEVKDHN